mmetsp:Transcript_14142/g.24022  ORF Transcript_14142/g.24022 Transcript_14142/m.24022 type:complete len:104 (+) Transcript_14142:374-685(+)
MHEEGYIHDYCIERIGARWRSDRLPPDVVDFYLREAKKNWPSQLVYKYKEEKALHFLHLKDYKVDEALLSIVYDVEELTKLIKLMKRQKVKPLRAVQSLQTMM